MFFLKRFAAFAAAVLMMFAFCLGAYAADDDVIVSFGDSITASGAWQSKLDAMFGTHIVNMGVGGDNSEQGLARLSSVLAKDPDVVILMFGANDTARDMSKGRSLGQFLTNMETMIDAFRSRDIKVICIMQSYYDAPAYYTRHDSSAFDDVGGIEAYMDMYIAAYRELAERKGCYIADVRSLCDAYPVRSEIIADGVHPNSKGYGLYVTAVADAIISVNMGDVNGDGKMNAMDYIRVKRHVLGMNLLDDIHVKYADTDRNGKVNAMDYYKIKRAVMGKYELR